MTTDYSDEQLAQARRLGTSTLFEASGLSTSSVDAAIRPVWAGALIAGPAYPLECSPGDNLAIHIAMEKAPRGSIFVISTGGFVAGYWGEVLTVAAEAAGILGLVIDGGVRDVAALTARRFPVFTRGISMRGTIKASAPSVGEPISFTGTPVAIGDLVVADDDGVLVVPAAHAAHTLAQGQLRADKETKMMESLTQGRSTLELMNLTKLESRRMTANQDLNRFLAAAKPSATYKVIDRVAARRAAGAKIISLSAGEPDFDTPAHVCDAGIEAIRRGQTRYTQVAGLRALREAVAAKFERENGLKVRWQDTLVTSGGKQVIFNAIAATINEGDEVVIPAPYWVSYPEIVQLCGGMPITISCGAESGFKLTPDALQAAITPRTRWVILNSPSNPTGAVYRHDELRALAEVLLAHPRVLVLCDDIYEHLVFDGIEFFTMAQAEPQLRDRVLTMNGVSKAYAMTGWRIGYCTGPTWLIEAMEKLQGQQTSGACSISQHAALAALTGPQGFIEQSRDSFQRRRDMVVELLNQTPGLHCEVPQGAFYAFASCAGLIGKTTAAGTQLHSDEDVVSALLDEANVATVHGSAFGLGPYIRIAYALDDAELRHACEAIQQFSRTLTN